MDKLVLDKFVATMTELLQSAKDFTLEQAPDVLRQLVAYERAITIFYVASCLLGAIALAFGTKQLLRHGDDLGDAAGAALLFLLVGELVVVIMFFHNVSDFLKVWVAPKVFLIEYFAHLVKG
jgi:hypothetical protein